MKTSLSTLLVVISLAASARAFGVEPQQHQHQHQHQTTSRRDVLAAAGLLVAGGAAVLPANALSACPPKSNNCIRTTWTAPDGTNVAKSMQAILDSYPQEGQNKVDLGGWSIAEGDLAKTGNVRVEYKSGLGNFAKFLNGNKPFVDDLEIAIDGNKVELRSASRIGDSDLGVNQKRLKFLAAQANAMGFEAPEPKY